MAEHTSDCAKCGRTIWTTGGNQEPHACLPADQFAAARAALMDEMGWEDDRFGVHVDYRGLVWAQASDCVQRVADVLLAGSEDHIIDVRDTGWTLLHPLACRPNLHDCPVNQAAVDAGEQLRAHLSTHGPGRYRCHLEESGDLVVDEAVPADV